MLSISVLRLSRAMRKRVLCHMRTTKAQISLRIRNGFSSVNKIPSLMLASVAEQASLSLTWSETPENTFSHDKAQTYFRPEDHTDCAGAPASYDLQSWGRTFEPSHEIMALFIGPLVYCHTLSVRTATTLARLRECAGSPEPSLVAYLISSIISWAGSF